jgi:AcrR family transcriptional regulator
MANHSQDAARTGRPVKIVRDEVVKVAWHLFEQQGFQATSMTQIAQQAGLSRRSLFNHFASKEALLYPAVDDFMDDFASLLSAQPKNSGLFDAMTACVFQLRDRMDELQHHLNPGPEVLRARLSEEGIAFNREVWAREMEELVLERLQGDPAAETQAGFVAAIVAQVWTEMAKLLRQQPELTIPVALERVTRSLGNLFGRDSVTDR